MLLKESLITPTRSTKIKKAYLSSLSIGITPYTADEALAFILDNNLTKQQYINIRKSAKLRNANIYPSYENILDSKKKCYPNNINITETFCEIPIQNLLDHTCTRIFQIENVLPLEQGMFDFELIYK